MEENTMGTRKILPLVISMGLPPMISMLIQSLYNIVDSIYVARIGENAITAISLAFPMQNIVLALAVGFGVGINSVVSRSLGSKNQKDVNDTCVHGFILTAFHALIFIFVGLFITEPFFKMFTTNEEVLSLGITYCRIVVSLGFFQLYHILIEKIFQAKGNVVIPMIMQILGSIINIILDPLFIFGYFGLPSLGVTGAAIATIIAQATSCSLSLILFMKYKGNIVLDFKHFHFNKRLVKNIYVVAIPSSLMSAMPSLLVSVLNGILSTISQTAVAVFGIYYKLQNFVYLPANGIIQGMRPIIGYNYGANQYHRVKETIKDCLLIIGGIMLLGTLLFTFAPSFILSLFSATKDMLEIGVPMLRIISLCFIISTVGVVFSGVFEALGKGRQSLIITILRQMSIIPILSLVFKNVWGIMGIWYTFIIAEFIAAFVSLYFYKKLHL